MAAAPTSFATDMKPLFGEQDRDAMSQRWIGEESA
jgi:hypothetical protein